MILKIIKINQNRKSLAIDPKSIDQEDLVFRVMDMDHIPLEPGRKKRILETKQKQKQKVNFPRSNIMAYIGGEIKEVARKSLAR